MPIQATVTVDEQVWSVTVASTIAELLQGLSGVESMPAGTGMLFDLGSEQAIIEINMTEMLFSLDVLLVNEALVVVGKVSNLPAGGTYSFTGNGGARYFMEVNAGELADVSIGGSVAIAGYTPGMPIDISSLMGMMIVVMMMSMIMKSVGGMFGSHSIHGPERERLVGIYGSWAVGRAESVCPADDVACVEREAVSLLAAYKKRAGGKYFYWSITNEETGEIFEQNYPYSAQGRAVWGARAFASKNIPKEHPVMIRIYDVPVPAGYEKRTEAPVYESRWLRG